MVASEVVERAAVEIVLGLSGLLGLGHSDRSKTESIAAELAAAGHTHAHRMAARHRGDHRLVEDTAVGIGQIRTPG